MLYICNIKGMYMCCWNFNNIMNGTKNHMRAIQLGIFWISICTYALYIYIWMDRIMSVSIHFAFCILAVLSVGLLLCELSFFNKQISLPCLHPRRVFVGFVYIYGSIKCGWQIGKVYWVWWCKLFRSITLSILCFCGCIFAVFIRCGYASALWLFIKHGKMQIKEN